MEQGPIEPTPQVDYMDQEDLIESDEGYENDVTQSRNELYKSNSPLVGRQSEAESPLKENMNSEISK